MGITPTLLYVNVAKNAANNGPVNDEISSVIRDDVAGEYFQITRHFRFDVARFIYYAPVPFVMHIHTHTYADIYRYRRIA